MSVERARFEREQEMSDAIGEATRQLETRVEDLEGDVQDLTNCIRFMVTVPACRDVTAELKRWALVYGVQTDKEREDDANS